MNKRKKEKERGGDGERARERVGRRERKKLRRETKYILQALVDYKSKSL